MNIKPIICIYFFILVNNRNKILGGNKLIIIYSMNGNSTSFKNLKENKLNKKDYVDYIRTVKKSSKDVFVFDKSQIH